MFLNALTCCNFWYFDLLQFDKKFIEHHLRIFQKTSQKRYAQVSYLDLGPKPLLVS